jgi:serine/threonine protein phosphatase PrpC
MDTSGEPVDETLLEGTAVEAKTQQGAGEKLPADSHLRVTGTEAGAAETAVAGAEASRETPAPAGGGDTLDREAGPESSVTAELPAVEPAQAEEGPGEPVPEPDETQTAPGDTTGEPEATAGAIEEGMSGEPAGARLPSPAPPGTRIADRFELVEMLDATDNEILYRAEDLNGCLQCDFEGNALDDGFCGHCGASLEQRPEALLLETRNPDAEPSSGQKVASRLTHEDRTFLLLSKEEPEREAEGASEVVRLLVGHTTDVGQVRGLNEDSLLVMTMASNYESEDRPVLGLLAVADGMGGHQGGEIASRMALQVLTREILENIILPELAGEPASKETIVNLMRMATEAANDAVFLARQKRENDMGTTLTIAFFRNDDLFLAHVGDSRAYRWNAEGLMQLTSDHSLVASMIASGQAEPDEIYTHPHRSVIHRCIGDQPVVEVDADALSITPGDRIVICSDGLWEMVRSEGIADVMLQESDPQAACDLLVRHANLAGGDDNISVIVAQMKA